MPEKYDFVDTVNEDFKCKKCQAVTREPHITSCCGETVCTTCLAAKKDCPSCEQENFETFLQQKYRASIEVLRVRCPHKQRGCEWIGKLIELETHTDKEQGGCDRVDIDCPKECHAVIQKCLLVTHLEHECPNRAHICSYCGINGTFVEIEEHIHDCSHYPIVCENKCGATFKRGELPDHKKICGLEEIECEHVFVGCNENFKREDREKHMKSMVEKHLDLLSAAFKQSQEKVKNLQEELEKQAAEQLKQADRIKQLEDKLENRLKELQEEMGEEIKEIKAKPHRGVFHCCTWCSSGGSKSITCGCGSRMPGGYSGCGHGHPGHPGTKHWSLWQH